PKLAGCTADAAVRGRSERDAGEIQGMKTTAGTIKLDQLDIKILDKLQADARITNQDLAEAVGLSPSPCLQRVKRLEKAGIIANYRVQIDLHAICRHVDVICAVTLKSH